MMPAPKPEVKASPTVLSPAIIVQAAAGKAKEIRGSR
jgi:hypothetical protein